MTQPQGQFPFQPVVQPQGQFPQQGYPQQQQFQQPMPVQPGYPAQQYNFPVPPPAAPAQPLAQGSLDDFFAQPTVGGGQALKFQRVGDSHTGVVSREITKADVQQQADTRGIPQFFRDGRPKYQLIVPLTMPDGSAATWYVKGATREALGDAMTKAGVPGAPQCAPERGATIRITYVGDRQTGAGFNPAKLYQVDYARPNDAAVSVAGAQAVVQQPMRQPAPDPAPVPQQNVYSQPSPMQSTVDQSAGAPPWQQQVPTGIGPQPMPTATAPQPVQQGPGGLPAAPEGLNADQLAAYNTLLAQMGGQPQG